MMSPPLIQEPAPLAAQLYLLSGLLRAGILLGTGLQSHERVSCIPRGLLF